MILSLAIIFGLLLLGNTISYLLHIPVPGSIIGMVMLTALLHFKIVKVDQIKGIANLLTTHMAFLFIPPGVALMLHFQTLKSELVTILGSCLISTVVVLIVVGFTQQKLDKSKDDE
ncbi:CidA/LrgA family protein [Sediminitomix flava]|uniref:Holin-like protein n=1 Tax=Sediminitomix flava TaxID=379075 RepID=A0A315Z651_SEDFL|nr:CidA/LrgA family protein [Sediminitomix flava]PWJ39347.1 holin-like protein [Sediminitomix flava]